MAIRKSPKLSAADKAAIIRAELQESGTPIGAMDIMVAACAISADATLITNNAKHFSRIKGLKFDNWI